MHFQKEICFYCNEGILSLIYKNMINRIHNCILNIYLVKHIKLCLFSGHDLTIAPILYQCNPTFAKNKWPVYADYVFFILFRLK